ncbi:very short patch repair endonuclease [Streptomyces sp. 900116325]|uniref:very short patch repair endonuclease n=1 Tax=Streptomyces sp. NPDC005525 TaxID=3364720 RepID=UPI0036B8480C
MATDDDKPALGSVILRRSTRTDRVHASLQWRTGPRTASVRLGEVDQATRAENLRAGWRLARQAGLLTLEIPEGSWARSAATRASMQANKGKNTKPEMRLRSILHRKGLRYRVSVRPVPSLRRTADVVFTAVKVAVFVDGCFWHGCPEHGSTPASNREFWARKIAVNRMRDAETTALLEQAGWTVVRVWEHIAPEEAAKTVMAAVAEARATSPSLREDDR